MKNVKRIYVCSPYTELKARGDACVRQAAITSMRVAAWHYNNERVELFSPVLTNMYQCENMSHDEAMKICFAQLRSCDEVFIGGDFGGRRILAQIRRSKGIAMEYEYAKEQGIPVVFDNNTLKNFYEKGLFYAKA